MKKNTIYTAIILLVFLASGRGNAQMNLDGEFRVRWYGDSFQDALDDRGAENYIRYAGRIRGKARLGEQALFSTELVAETDNSSVPTRNIAGTGNMIYGISELFAEINQPDFLVFDLARLRAGRQQFPIGNGLSFGESYNPNKFDGARLDLAKGIFTLSMFGAITGQNLSPSGLYPEPGSDQVYVARLGANVPHQDLMLYYILQKPRGDFNDSYIVGGGTNVSITDKLGYFVEVARQGYNTAPGLPEKSGYGFMGGATYQWSLGPFKSMKAETRYAFYQEQFSPLYPSFFWGARAGYVDGDIGGDYPHDAQNLEGSRIWFSRLYVIPKILPKVRIQVQYTKVNEFSDANNNNFMDDEFAARLYYTFSTQVQLQFRYSQTLPNNGDFDLDGDGKISSTEDRFNTTTYMLEMQVKF